MWGVRSWCWGVDDDVMMFCRPLFIFTSTMRTKSMLSSADDSQNEFSIGFKSNTNYAFINRRLLVANRPVMNAPGAWKMLSDFYFGFSILYSVSMVMDVSASSPHTMIVVQVKAEQFFFHIIHCNKHQQWAFVLGHVCWVSERPDIYQTSKQPMALEPVCQWKIMHSHFWLFELTSMTRRRRSTTRMIRLGARGCLYHVDSSKVMCQWQRKDREFRHFFLIYFYLCRLFTFMRQAIWLSAMHQMCDKRVAECRVNIWERIRSQRCSLAQHESNKYFPH